MGRNLQGLQIRETVEQARLDMKDSILPQESAQKIN